MTLNQYYDAFVRREYGQSWKSYCAQVSETEREYLKKRLKREYKALKKGSNARQ